MQHSCFVPIFFSKHFVRVQVVQPFSSADTATAWKNSHFILSEGSDFDIIDNLSIAVHAFPMCIVTLLSVDEILLFRYVNWSTDL